MTHGGDVLVACVGFALCAFLFLVRGEDEDRPLGCFFTLLTVLFGCMLMQIVLDRVLG